jgi:hypothetical protein
MKFTYNNKNKKNIISKNIINKVTINNHKRKIYPCACEINNNVYNYILSNNYLSKLNDLDSNIYNLLCKLRIDAISFDNIDDVNIINTHKKHFNICQIKKIKSKLHNFNNNIDEEYIIVKKYNCFNDDDYYNTVNLLQKEVFFHLIAKNKTTINVPKIYYWGFDCKNKSGYIVMSCIDTKKYSLYRQNIQKIKKLL